MLFSLGYGCGLRACEVVRLKVKHIDSGEDHSGRAIEEPQGPQCHAVPDARAAAPIVETPPAGFRFPQLPVEERWLFPGQTSGKPMRRPSQLNRPCSMRRPMRPESR